MLLIMFEIYMYINTYRLWLSFILTNGYEKLRIFYVYVYLKCLCNEYLSCVLSGKIFLSSLHVVDNILSVKSMIEL